MRVRRRRLATATATTEDSEHIEQSKFVSWSRRQELSDGKFIIDFLFAIPNGEQRSRTTGAKLKREGVKPGVSDLFLALPANNCYGLFIEMKRKGGKVQKNQLEWIQLMRSVGYGAEVCFGYEEAIECVGGYLDGKEPS